MQFRLLVLVGILYLFSSSAVCQSVKLKILRGNSEIGFIHALKTVNDDSVSYVSESELNFKFIWNYEWKSTVSSILKDGTMSWSRLVSFLNDKPRDDKHTFYRDNKYYSYNFEEQDEDIREPIHFTSLMMYYQEPAGIKSLYSERFQKMVQVEEIEDHTYKIKFPNGDINHYFYNGIGKLQKVDAFRKWFDLVFVPE